MSQLEDDAELEWKQISFSANMKTMQQSGMQRDEYGSRSTRVDSDWTTDGGYTSSFKRAVSGTVVVGSLGGGSITMEGHANNAENEGQNNNGNGNGQWQGETTYGYEKTRNDWDTTEFYTSSIQGHQYTWYDVLGMRHLFGYSESSQQITKEGTLKTSYESTRTEDVNEGKTQFYNVNVESGNGEIHRSTGTYTTHYTHSNFVSENENVTYEKDQDDQWQISGGSCDSFGYGDWTYAESQNASDYTYYPNRDGFESVSYEGVYTFDTDLGGGYNWNSYSSYQHADGWQLRSGQSDSTIKGGSDEMHDWSETKIRNDYIEKDAQYVFSSQGVDGKFDQTVQNNAWVTTNSSTTAPVLDEREEERKRGDESETYNSSYRMTWTIATDGTERLSGLDYSFEGDVLFSTDIGAIYQVRYVGLPQQIATPPGKSGPGTKEADPVTDPGKPSLPSGNTPTQTLPDDIWERLKNPILAQIADVGIDHGFNSDDVTPLENTTKSFQDKMKGWWKKRQEDANRLLEREGEKLLDKYKPDNPMDAAWQGYKKGLSKIIPSAPDLQSPPEPSDYERRHPAIQNEAKSTPHIDNAEKKSRTKLKWIEIEIIVYPEDIWNKIDPPPKTPKKTTPPDTIIPKNLFDY